VGELLEALKNLQGVYPLWIARPPDCGAPQSVGPQLSPPNLFEKPKPEKEVQPVIDLVKRVIEGLPERNLWPEVSGALRRLTSSPKILYG
jgi:hypothetical protein